MFGMGGAILPGSTSSIRRRPSHFDNRTSRRRGTVMDGYARATGRPGVCVVTVGAGGDQHGDQAAGRRWMPISIWYFGAGATKVLGE